MSFNLSSLLKPTGGLRIGASWFGKNLSPAQEQMLGDWDKGKFQRSDLPLARGVLAMNADNMVAGIPFAEESAQWHDRHASNTFGNSKGTEEQTAYANQQGFGTAESVAARKAEIERLKSMGYVE